jgi:superfamily II DNA or RNA helicase/HKD family nuclease
MRRQGPAFCNLMPKALFDGVYEHLLTEGLAEDIGALDAPRLHKLEPLDESDAHEVLARHLMREVATALSGVSGKDQLKTQIAVVNHLLRELRAQLPDADGTVASEVRPEARELFAIYSREPQPPRPSTPLASSTLLTRNRAEPSLSSELAHEIETADRIDVLVAFISMGGLRALRSALDRFALRLGHEPERFRILTTVYSGTTEAAAVDGLARLPGARVKVSYDVRRTRLHAKAWMFHRNTGLHTAYVGSANLTSTALGSGQEWMVKVCAADLPHVIETFRGTFEGLWNDAEFEPYDIDDDACVNRLRVALKQQREPSQSPQQFFTLRPFPFQQEILDKLDTERVVHGRLRNLVVAATGTGKTVVAAFDYQRHAERARSRPRLLFLAHRKELLEQALRTFRQVLRDGSFGELWIDGEAPKHWEHVFASIQSASRPGALDRVGHEHFRFVVVDECHHAPAASYQALVPNLRPDVLLGLTATPERSDGKSLLPDFDGHIAAELRIWHALERQLLVPFEYYGISDNTDLTHVRMSRGGYDAADLAQVYTGHHARVDLIVEQLTQRVANILDVRAIAFCVSVEHAEFMAKALSERGLRALAVHGATNGEERDAAPRRLEAREVQVLCTCDLYNEGVDLPFVDTLLLLRPTSSATIFLQQLGRGLRHSSNKQSCLVLDFIGTHRADFRFDEVLCALTNTPRSKLEKMVEDGFPFLPSGCVLQLDRVAQEQVLESVRAQLHGRKGMIRDLQLQLQQGVRPTLASYLRDSGRSLEEVYGKNDSSWTALQRRAGLLVDDGGAEEVSVKFGHLLHIDEVERLKLLATPPAASTTPLESRRYAMIATQLERFGVIKTAEEITAYLTHQPAAADELQQLKVVLGDRIAFAEAKLPVAEWPLALHRHYRGREVLAAIGRAASGQKNPGLLKGVFKVPDRRQELLFVTLDKSARSFSPTTRYRDHAISPDLFHWETPSAASVSRDSGRRYIESPGNGWSFFLFVRTDTDAAFGFLGPVHYVSHEGDRPIAITWRLEHPLPAALYDRYATLAQP